jgi:hypothetical protein
LLRLGIEYNDLKRKTNWGETLLSLSAFFIKAKDNAGGCEEEPGHRQTIIITETSVSWNSGAWLLNRRIGIWRVSYRSEV